MKMEKGCNYLKQNKLQFCYIFYFKINYLFICLVVVWIYNNNYVRVYLDAQTLRINDMESIFADNKSINLLILAS